MSDRLRTTIIAIVTVVWAANFTAPVFVHRYEPKAEINVVFMAIVGVLTASYKVGKSDENDNFEK